MTISYHIAIANKLSKVQQKKVKKAIDSTFKQTDRIYNNWNPSSEISQINQSSSLTPHLISKELKDILLRCDECYKITDKRFDPTIGSIFNEWKKALLKNLIPIKVNNDAVGWSNLILNKRSLQKKHPKCQLDLCGISKGYTIDLLAEKLKELGYNNFFIEWGGEILAKGRSSQDKKWSVQINGILEKNEGKLNLENNAIATSGCFMLYDWTAANKAYFHIFDPNLKRPLEKNSISTVTVIAKTCYIADAIATAAMTFSDIYKLKEWGTKIVSEYPEISFIILHSKNKNIERISSK